MTSCVCGQGDTVNAMVRLELRANVIRAAGPAMYDLVLGTINALVAAQIANDSGFLGHADLAGLASRLEHGLAEALNG